MDTYKTGVGVLVWTFMVILMYSIGNTMIFGYVEPVMDDIANVSNDSQPGGFVNTDRYEAGKNVFLSAFNIACFILLLIPYAYLFVRLLLKKEATTTPYGGPQPGGWG